MKKQFFLFTLIFSALLGHSQTNATFHSFDVKTIIGDTINLGQFSGKKILVVNTASFCGYTYQYGLLESLYEQYNQNYNFEIIGFPCNDFGNQEPGHDSTILEFCTNTYDVQFPMMSSIHIRTGDTAAVYKWLQRGDLNGVADVAVDWNFNKFLIDENGNWVNHFTSTVSPLDTAIVDWITSGSVTTKMDEVPSEILRIFNGPANSIQLQYEGLPKSAQFSLYTIDGKLLLSKQLNLINGNQLISLDGVNFSNGLFFTKIEIENKPIHRTIVLIGSN